MRYPYVQVAAETWETADQLALLFRIDPALAFRLIVTLYRWGQSLGPEGEDPTGVCESPRAARLMAVAVGVDPAHATELAEHLEDLGLIEVMAGGPVRVKGVRERYAGMTARAEERAEKARKAAEARWGAQRMPDACSTDAPSMPRASSTGARPMLGDAQTQTQTQTHNVEKQLRLSAEPPADRAVVVFEHWRKVMAKNARTAFDVKRRKAVDARLADGYAVEDLCAAIDGCSRTPHNMGKNDRGERFDDLELICRDAAHVDRFRATAEAVGPPARARPDHDALLEAVEIAKGIADPQLLSQLTQLTWHRDQHRLRGTTSDPFYAKWLSDTYGPGLNELAAARGIELHVEATEGAAA